MTQSFRQVGRLWIVHSRKCIRKIQKLRLSKRKTKMIVEYNGQKLRYIKDFHGREVLWIMKPEQTKMPGMTFVGGYPNEYCIFLDELSETEQAEIRKQVEHEL